MFKKLFMLFRIGRKLSTSGAISSIYEIYNPPITIKIFFYLIGCGSKDKEKNKNTSAGERLCNALQDMDIRILSMYIKRSIYTFRL